MKGGLSLRRKIIDGVNLPSICCVYEKKNVTRTEELVLQVHTLLQIQKVKTFDSDRKSNQFNSKQIIRIVHM